MGVCLGEKQALHDAYACLHHQHGKLVLLRLKGESPYGVRVSGGSRSAEWIVGMLAIKRERFDLHQSSKLDGFDRDPCCVSARTWHVQPRLFRRGNA